MKIRFLTFLLSFLTTERPPMRAVYLNNKKPTLTDLPQISGAGDFPPFIDKG